MESLLHPLSGEHFSHRSANNVSNARLNIHARDFCSSGQDTFFDVRVFHPNVSSNRSSTIAAVYWKHETIKKREYAQRVLKVEHGVFTPLIFSTTGGMGREATTFYKRLADKIANKHETFYPKVMGWLHCRLSFAILRSAILCIHRSHSSYHWLIHELNIALATSNGHIPSTDLWTSYCFPVFLIFILLLHS